MMSLRWSEEEYAAFVRRGQRQPAPMSEAVWQRTVIRLAQQHGWSFIYHTFDSRRSPSGFMDLVCVHRDPGHPLLCVELKTDTGQVTLAQQAWLEALGQCSGVVAEVWKPSMLQEVVEKLR